MVNKMDGARTEEKRKTLGKIREDGWSNSG